MANGKIQFMAKVKLKNEHIEKRFCTVDFLLTKSVYFKFSRFQ